MQIDYLFVFELYQNMLWLHRIYQECASARPLFKSTFESLDSVSKTLSKQDMASEYLLCYLESNPSETKRLDHLVQVLEHTQSTIGLFLSIHLRFVRQSPLLTNAAKLSVQSQVLS